MAFGDFLKPLWQSAMEAHIPQAAATMALSYPASLIAGSVTKRPYRADAQRAAGGLFTQLAFNQLMRPQQEQGQLMNALMNRGELDFEPPTPGATPYGQFAGKDVYRLPRISETPEFKALQPTTAENFPAPGQEQAGFYTPVPGRYGPDAQSPQLGSPEQSLYHTMLGRLRATDPNMLKVAAWQQHQQEEASTQALLDKALSGQGTGGGFSGLLEPVFTKGPKGLSVTLKPHEDRLYPVGPGGLVTATGEQVVPPREGAGRKSTLADYKLGLLREYQPGQVPTGWKGTEEEFKNFVGLNKGKDIATLVNELVQGETTRSNIASLTKEQDLLRKQVYPLRGHIQKYPDGNIPLEEFTKVEQDNYPLDENGLALFQADLARMKEIDQIKRRFQQQGTTAPPQPAHMSIDDFIKTLQQ